MTKKLTVFQLKNCCFGGKCKIVIFDCLIFQEQQFLATTLVALILLFAFMLFGFAWAFIDFDWMLIDLPTANGTKHTF